MIDVIEKSKESMMQLINEIQNMSEAIRCCVRMSGLSDKQVYLELGIDPGQWSRISNGIAHFPHERVLDLMRICRNDIPLMWLANKRGYELKLSQRTFEEILNQEREEKNNLQKKLDSILDLLQKTNFPSIPP